jgi:hypothetical protein
MQVGEIENLLLWWAKHDKKSPNVSYFTHKMFAIVTFKIKTRHIFSTLLMWPLISNNLGWHWNFRSFCLDYEKNGLNDVHVGCDDKKTKDIDDFITFEQIMIKDYTKLIEEQYLFE